MVEKHDGEHLAVLMQRHGVTDTKLADATNSSVQAVGKWKRTGQIARDKIAPICRAVHAKSDELLGLMPIADIAEQPAAYRLGPDPDLLREALMIVRRALSQPGVSVTNDGFAEFVMAVYDMLGNGQTPESAERIVAGMLRAFAVKAARESS
jgi:hypothetical protein